MTPLNLGIDRILTNEWDKNVVLDSMYVSTPSNTDIRCRHDMKRRKVILQTQSVILAYQGSILQSAVIDHIDH
jgi:hypothetical protein